MSNCDRLIYRPLAIVYRNVLQVPLVMCISHITSSYILRISLISLLRRTVLARNLIFFKDDVFVGRLGLTYIAHLANSGAYHSTRGGIFRGWHLIPRCIMLIGILILQPVTISNKLSHSLNTMLINLRI